MSTHSKCKRRNSPGNRSDIGWKHAIKLDNPPRIQCNYCAKIINSGGIFRLKHHLAGTSKDVEACKSVPMEVKEQMNEVINSNERGKIIGGNNVVEKGSASTIPEIISEFSEKDLRDEACEISVTFLEKEVKKTLGLFEDYKAEWKKTGCSIILNGWKNKENNYLYCNTYLNVLSRTLFVSSKIVYWPFESLDILNILNEIIEKVGEENVVQVIIGGDFDVEYCGEIEDMFQEKWTKIFWTPCLYDCIEYILPYLDASRGDLMLQVNSIARLIYSSSMLISMLKQFTNGEDLVRVGQLPTDYTATYWTMLRFKHLKQPLMNMFVSEQWKSTIFASTPSGKDIQKLILNSIFWEEIDEFLSAASPLIRILDMLNSHKIPSMGFIYEELSNAKKEIQQNLKDKDRFKYLWTLWHGLFDIPLYEAAYYLNPFFHFSPNFNNDDSIKKGLQDCLKRMISDVEERSKIDRQIKEFEGAKNFFAKSVAKKKKTPVEWWDSYGDGLPELQRLAIRILSLTCCSSGYEQDQSTLEIVLNRRSRSNLQQQKKKLNELIFAMQNLRLRNQQASRNALGKTTLDDLSPVDECLYSDDDPCVDDDGGLSILNSILDDTHSKEDDEGFSLNDLAFEYDMEDMEVQVSNN